MEKMEKKPTVFMHREYKEMSAPLTNRYGVVVDGEWTYQSDALEGIMDFIINLERFIDPEPTLEKTMRRWAKLAEEHYGVCVPTTSVREFLEAMPKECIAFYEDPSYPISPHSKLV